MESVINRVSSLLTDPLLDSVTIYFRVEKRIFEFKSSKQDESFVHHIDSLSQSTASVDSTNSPSISDVLGSVESLTVRENNMPTVQTVKPVALAAKKRSNPGKNQRRKTRLSKDTRPRIDKTAVKTAVSGHLEGRVQESEDNIINALDLPNAVTSHNPPKAFISVSSPIKIGLRGGTPLHEYHNSFSGRENELPVELYKKLKLYHALAIPPMFYFTTERVEFHRNISRAFVEGDALQLPLTEKISQFIKVNSEMLGDYLRSGVVKIVR
jgi:hypothetical protein